MMTREKWIRNILEIVSQIADSDFQRRAWIKFELDYPCHFEEIMSKLYDDGDLANFVENYSKKFQLTPDQTKTLREFRSKLDVFCEKSNLYMEKVPYKKIDEKKVLADPEWRDIQLLARKVLEAFQEN